LDPDKILFYAQLVVQFFLIVMVLVLIFRDKQKSVPSQALDELRRMLDETAAINTQFSSLIQQKLEMVKDLLRELDHKMEAAQAMKEGLDESILNTQTKKNYSKGDVIRLSNTGLTALEIARITGIPEGEVHLMLKLAGQDEA